MPKRRWTVTKKFKSEVLCHLYRGDRSVAAIGSVLRVLDRLFCQLIGDLTPDDSTAVMNYLQRTQQI